MDGVDESIFVVAQLVDVILKKIARREKNLRQVGRGGVDRASSSDARGPGFEPRPLHLKKYHFFTRNQVALRS